MAGVPGLCICEPFGMWHGLYIEMKSKGGMVSKKQDEFMVALSERGYYVEVCCGADESILVINEYFGYG